MATIRVPIGSAFIMQTATTTYVLGDASQDTDAGGLIIHIVNTGSMSMSIVVSAQSRLLARAGATDAFLAIPYRSLNVNASVGTGAYVTTAITAASILFVPSNGLQIALVNTWTSGSCTVYAEPVVGSCAI